MKTTAKRILSVCLTMAMLFSLCGVALADGSVELNVGETQTLHSSYSGDTYDWSSSSSSVTVSGSGSSATIRGASAGNAVISVTVKKEIDNVETVPYDTGEVDEDGNPIVVEQEVHSSTTETVGSESWNVTVNAAAEPLSVSISPSDLNLTVGEGSGSLSARTTGGAGSPSFNWSSGNDSVASVSGSGSSATVTPNGAGSTTITLTVTDGDQSESDSITVRVNAATQPLSVSISPSNLSLTMGESDGSLSARTTGGAGNPSFNWSSGNDSIASVSGSGSSVTVTPNGVGATTISVTATDGGESSSDSITVMVSEPVRPLEELNVVISPASGLSLKMGGESGARSASVSGASGNVSYSWVSRDTNVASVSGNGRSATVVPVGVGTATIVVTASDDSRSTTDSVVISVAKADVTRVMASASGSTTMTTDVGKTETIAATVSGGSGSYEFVWNASGVVEITDKMRGSATIRGTDQGDGSVSLYVYDADDHSNYDVLTWNIKVNGAAAPLNVEISPATLEINVGGTGTLSANVSGGSSNSSGYEYVWTTNNGIVTVAGNNGAATVSGGSAGTAVVTVTVTDRATRTSKKATCTVTVKSKDASYNASGTATVGENSTVANVASSIATGFQNAFRVALSSSASVRFTSPSAAIGQLRLSNGSLVAANTSYTYSQFSSMYLYSTAAGSFSTAYTLNDNGNVLSGTITITAAGGTTVTSVTISQTSVSLDTYSGYFLNLGIMPSNAYYTVSWSTSNSSIAYIDGSGSSVTVCTRGKSGTATITANVLSNGKSIQRTCTVYVSDANNSTYNPSLTLTVDSDYYGTDLANNFRDRYRSVYGYSMGDDATMRFSSIGSSRIAVTRLSNGSAIKTNTNYSFAQYSAMSVTPVSAGTITADYKLTYNNNSLSGTITIYVRSANVSATISPSTMTLAPNSNQSISVNVTPASSYYSVSWDSNNTSVASVSGNGNLATVNAKNKAGTAKISATVTDRNGVKVVRSCVVTVNEAGSVYNPSLTMTLGVNYTGTALSSALSSQFRSVYNMTLNNDSAKIRFASLGNSSIAVTHLSNGKLISANTDYTFTQYIGMYVEPLSAGSFDVPYTLTYNGKSLTGTVMVSVAAGSVSSALRLTGMNPYTFSETSADGTAGSTLLGDAIRNAVGSSWSYIRFGNTSSAAGTLYQNSSRASLSGVNIFASSLGSLYFVPAQTGNYSVDFMVYNSKDGSLAKGTLMISVSSGSSGAVTFSDVKASDWFGTSVLWAVNRNITNGTSASTFSPNQTCTTAQILTFLWRSKGSPMPSISNPFTDVKQSDYYYNAALWAYENNLVSGTQFNGSQACTRASTVVFLWRLAGMPEAMSSGFTDVPAGTEMASAVNWAVSKGITNGVSPKSFDPSAICNRGQIVTFLYRAYA